VLAATGGCTRHRPCRRRHRAAARARPRWRRTGFRDRLDWPVLGFALVAMALRVPRPPDWRRWRRSRVDLRGTR
jgi:hypothetical protein